ncbi:uncharacterized protein LOC124456456 [Xenia sp. Carnegie-2017]|uniref:uncharacterized protein LOC124456456 n=1 Tax=Xenia sp. Carnegie-2017 TaxID=2897299 RepID=UPI001F03CC40|nr:uncharacterized protein LOC124456456 [Xenia sp. Carnegie-2017]
MYIALGCLLHLDEITKAVNKNVEWVKNKLRTLRNCYTKAKKAPPSGTARRNLSKRTSWVLDKLQFLEEHVAIRATTSNMDDTNSLLARDNSDNENGSMLQHAIDSDEDLNTLDLTDNNQQVIKSTKLPTKPRGKSLKRKLEEEELSVMRSLTSAIVNDSKKAQEDKEPGKCESFGKFLVELLKKMDQQSRHYAQYQISNVLFQAQIGMLNPVQNNSNTPQQDRCTS